MKKILFSVILFFIIFNIIISPQTYIEVSFNAILIWAKVLLPSLLPFFIFTKLLTNFGCIQSISTLFKTTTYKLYKTPPISAYVFFMSILTGYPVGSKLTADLYQNGQISKLDAKKCITFTSNSGPMFIIGSVGIGMLISKTSGYIILISHILGALINGLIYRNIKTDTKNKNQINYSLPSQEATLSSCVMDSIFSILLIGGIMIIAFIIIEILNNLNVFAPLNSILTTLGLNYNISNSLINGFFEITKGCLSISNLSCSIDIKTVLSCAIISFGGLSTILQAMAFLKHICSYKFFIIQKITHMIFSTTICAIICTVF